MLRRGVAPFKALHASTFDRILTRATRRYTDMNISFVTESTKRTKAKFAHVDREGRADNFLARVKESTVYKTIVGTADG